jgi:uncharacterized repeat protein (TIGR02543 family)
MNNLNELLNKTLSTRQTVGIISTLGLFIMLVVFYSYDFQNKSNVASVSVATEGNFASTDFGLDATVLAKWDVVPYQTFTGTMNVGAVAFHVNDIDRVEFFVNGTLVGTEREMRMNLETGVVEYYVTLNASNYPDGQIQVTATAYPKAGPSRTLEPLLLYSNKNNTLSNEIRYVTNKENSNDANDCRTEATACKTMLGAINSVYKSNTDGSKSVDGAEIRLGEGRWQLEDIPGGLTGDPWWIPSYYADSRWITITSIPGLDKNKVKITGSNLYGFQLKLVQLKNLSVVGNLQPGLANFTPSIWFDKSNMYYEDPDIIAKGCGGVFHGYGSNWKSIFYTDIYMDNVCDGPREAHIVRNVYNEHSGAGHSSGSGLVINYSVKTIYGSGNKLPSGAITPDYHGDIYQFLGNQDVILYGINTVPGGIVSSRGIAGAENNVAMVDVDIETSGWVYSACTPINNLIFKNSIFRGGSSPWCGEGSATFDPSAVKNVLIENTQFINGTADNLIHPVDVPGIVYRFTNSTTTPSSTYKLTVSKSGTGSGTVLGTGINCGSNCSESFTTSSNTTVTLNVEPSSDSTFEGWTGCTSVSNNVCTVNMTSNTTVYAKFTKIIVEPPTTPIITSPINNTIYPSNTTSATISWTGDASNYMIRYTINGTNETKVNTANKSYSIPVSQGNTYQFYVAAGTATNKSTEANVNFAVERQTSVVIETPTILTPSDNYVYPSNTRSVTVAWTNTAPSYLVKVTNLTSDKQNRKKDNTYIYKDNYTSTSLKISVSRGNTYKVTVQGGTASNRTAEAVTTFMIVR